MTEHKKLVAQFLFTGSNSFDYDVFCLPVKFQSYISLLQTHFITTVQPVKTTDQLQPR
jgi:hypothetical protein